MKKSLLIVLFLFSVHIVSAHAGHAEHSSFEQAEALINAEIPCELLTEEQLEMIGDYYMEQMHPGEEHERMDEMMGGEGSEALRDMHVRMARSMYCSEETEGMGGESHAMMSHAMGRSTIVWVSLFALGVFGVVFWWLRS
ncbi:hypothetical protein D6789_00455 [Candidatus Woesearchaeota archaeon]|nr:MAG: hypothetical protein D6789_00455 [Candidatus Woesearchaeota archaeon]